MHPNLRIGRRHLRKGTEKWVETPWPRQEQLGLFSSGRVRVQAAQKIEIRQASIEYATKFYDTGPLARTRMPGSFCEPKYHDRVPHFLFSSPDIQLIFASGNRYRLCSIRRKYFSRVQAIDVFSFAKQTAVFSIELIV